MKTQAVQGICLLSLELAWNNISTLNGTYLRFHKICFLHGQAYGTSNAKTAQKFPLE